MRPLMSHWPLAAAIASALMLATAHAFQTFGHLAPCELCLKQREVYWVALAVGIVGYVVTRLARRPVASSLVCLALGLIFLFGAWLAAYHAGVEWKFWPGPKSCAGAGAASAKALSDLLSGAKVARPACDVAAWRLLGVSMAGWNALISLGLALLSVRAMVSRRRGLEPA